MKADSAFCLRGLSFAYDMRPVLRVVGLDIEPGRATAFVGPNGSGKTTLLKLMNGLLGPFRGQLHFFGKPLASGAALRARSVYVHQHPVLFSGTIYDNIAYALRIRRLPAVQVRERVASAARRLGLEDRLDRDARRLSGGETQRVAVARAVAFGADVLLLDEPTSALDLESDASLRLTLAALKTEGTTLVFSTHNHELARDLADRIVHFKDGEVQT
jgi:tungstate transport system ATP-binding protein